MIEAMRRQAASLNDLKYKADQGNVGAMFEYGMRMKNGMGCEPDFQEAVKYLTLASERGVSDAALELGICYAFGMGVSRDEKKSTDWFRRGAELGNPEAMYRLFQNLSIGAGCGINLSEADAWLRNAAELGHVRAEETLHQLKASKRLGQDLRSESYEIPEDSVSYVSIETVSPSERMGIINSSDEEKNDTIISESYIPPVPANVKGRLILIYAVCGALSGFLLMSVFKKGIYVMNSGDVASAFSSESSITIFMVSVGAVVGLAVGLILGKIMPRVKEKLLLYFPILLLPFAVMAVSPLIIALFGGLATLFTGLLTIIAYVIAGFTLLGSSSGN